MTRHVGGIAVGAFAFNDDRRAADYQAMRNANVSYIRTDLNWAFLQPTSSPTFSWSTFDPVISDIVSRGMKALPILHHVPDWANGATDDYYKPPLNLANYTNYAYQVAKRYIPMGVVDYEVGNEINLPHSASWDPGTNVFGGDYATKMLAPISQGLRQAASELGTHVNVIFGSMAPTDWTGGEDQLTMLEEAYAAGAKTLFDNIAWHPYIDVNSDTIFTASNFNSDTVALHNKLVAHGDSGKLIWATEFGEPTIAITGVTVTQQAQMVTDAFNQWATLPGVGPMFWYSHRDKSPFPPDPASNSDRENYFGVLYVDGTPKPAYTNLTNALVYGAVLSQTLGQATELDISSARLRDKTVGLLLLPAVSFTKVQPGKRKAIGQATETSTAQRISRPTGQTSETELAQTITPVKLVLGGVLGEATETNVPSPLLSAQTVAGLLLAFVYAPTRIGSLKTLAIGQATEANTARPLPSHVGQASESSTAQPVRFTRALTVGQATETDTASGKLIGRTSAGLLLALAIGYSQVQARKSAALAQPSEVDEAHTAGHNQTITIGQVVETATVGHVRPVLGQTVEVDAAAAVTARKTDTAGQAAETSTGQDINPIKLVPAGNVVQVAETGISSARLGSHTGAGLLLALTTVPTMVQATKTVHVVQVVETSTVGALSGAQTTAVGQASETNTGQPVAAVKVATASQAAETDTAQATTVGKAARLAQPVETDVAQQAVVTVPGEAAETDVGQPVTVLKTVAVGQVTESGTAQTVTPGKTIAAGQVVETDTATTLGALKTVTVGQVSGPDTAQTITGLKPVPIGGQATEVDTAAVVTSAKTTSVAMLVETSTAQAITVLRTYAAVGATETSAAQSASSLKTIAVVQTGESATVGPPGRLHTAAVGQATESCTGQTIGSAKAHAYTGIAESDTAQAMRRVKVVHVAQVLGRERACIVALRFYPWSGTGETDTAQQLLVQGGAPLVPDIIARIGTERVTAHVGTE